METDLLIVLHINTQLHACKSLLMAELMIFLFYLACTRHNTLSHTISNAGLSINTCG